MVRFYRTFPRAVAVLSALVLLSAVACGDDDDDSEGSTSGSSSPVKLMTWQSMDNPNYSAPQVKTAAEAAVRGINERGGINGRQVSLTFCDTNFDPNQEAACARQAVGEGFAAVVGSPSFYPNTLPILERGGVASIGGQGLAPAELNSPISFPLAGGAPGWAWGAAALAVERGVKRPAVVLSPVGAAQFAAKGVQDGFKAAGIEVARVVEAPLGLPDQAAAAAQAADGTDGIIIVAVPSDARKIVQSLRQLNYAGTVGGASLTFAEIVAELGAEADGLVMSSLAKPVGSDDPEVERFVAEMTAQDPGALRDEKGQMTWASYQLVAQLMSQIDGEIDSKTVLAAMSELSEPIETGLVAPYRVAGATSPVPEYSRLFNPTVVFNEVRGGVIVQTSPDFVNPFERLGGAGG